MVHEDVFTVYQLEQAIFPDPWSIHAFWMELQQDEFGVNLVATADKEIVAYTISRIFADELHLFNIAVKSEFRGLGLGKTILWLIIKIASQQNIKNFYLEVRKSNLAAIDLYKKFGFEIIGIRKQYYFHNQEDAILMSKII